MYQVAATVLPATPAPLSPYRCSLFLWGVTTKNL